MNLKIKQNFKKILIIFLINIQFVFAQGQDENISSSLATNSWEPSYFAMILGLILVIALVYISAFVYQKLSKVKLNNTLNQTNTPEIVSTTPLGQNRNLHIIKIKDEYILIGSTQNSITHIKDLDFFE